MSNQERKPSTTNQKNTWFTSRTADYLDGFACIGPACEDNCCVGWDVDIDQVTFKKYQGVQDEVLTRMFKKHVHKNPYCYSNDVDYGVVRLTKQKQCPFLDETRLCRIQARLGEGYLSNVCHTFPRYTNVVDGVYEHSATVSCPEIARKLLLKKEGVRFVEEKSDKGRHIVTNNLNTAQLQKTDPRVHVLFFNEIRTFSIAVLQDRRYRLWERLLILGYFCSLAEVAENAKDIMATFMEEMESGTIRSRYGAVKTDVSMQMALLQEVAEKLNVFSEVDSGSYIEFTKQFLSGLGHDNKGRSNESMGVKSKRYQDAAADYYEPYMAEREYMLENFLVNFVFKNLFPYSETYTLMEAYMTLVIRYALIRMNLIGISAYHKGLKDETVVAYIQAFSKTVEHHRTYLDDMVLLLGSKGHRNLNKMAILLKN